MNNLFKNTPYQMELPLIIRGDSIGKDNKEKTFHGFKTRAEFLEAVRMDRELKYIQGVKNGI